MLKFEQEKEEDGLGFFALKTVERDGDGGWGFGGGGHGAAFVPYRMCVHACVPFCVCVTGAVHRGH